MDFLNSSSKHTFHHRPPEKMSSPTTRPKLGDVFPNYDLETTHGNFKLHDFIGDSWGELLVAW
jgi:hypothetical protein